MAVDIPLRGPFCDTAEVVNATSTAFGSADCMVYPILPDDRVGESVVTVPAISLTACVRFPCCAVRVIKPATFISGEEREELTEDRRHGVPLHLLGISL